MSVTNLPAQLKQLTPENWLSPDPASEIFVLLNRDTGTERQPSGEDYVRHALAITIPESVPSDIRTLFEVARGALVYGYLYYPLFTVGMQQMLRVAEAGVRRRCELEGVPVKHRYTKLIDILTDRGVISTVKRERWHALRELRNVSSHPNMQEIMPPGIAFGFAAIVAELLTEMFDLKSSAA